MVRQTPKAPAKSTKKSPRKNPTDNPVSPELREQWIAKAAYFRAQLRGFAHGHALEDWVEAEKEIDRQLKEGNPDR